MIKYSAKYFGKTSQIVARFKPDSIVTLQFFQRADGVVLCGINEVLELLQQNTNTAKYTIRYLKEGTILANKQVVLELEGHYQDFGVYEGVIDGILARQSSIATNARQVVTAAGPKQLVFMGDRADYYLNQPGDGYAAALGGISTQVTDAQVERHGGKAIGTMPHALIQMFGGDLIAALEAYHATFPEEKLSALVDFNNDCVTDAVKALKHFGSKLGAIRIDTSAAMIDKTFVAGEPEFGVTPELVKRVKNALVANGGEHVKIIVSSGFSVEKIAEFEQLQTPVDIYGIGASLQRIWVNFSCDAVRLNGQNIAKAGRGYQAMKDYLIFGQK